MGRPRSRATILARPMAAPPPAATRPSAPRAAAIPACATGFGHVHHGLRMQPRRARAQDCKQPLAEARPAPGRCDHQRTAQIEPRRFVADALDRARAEHDALGLDLVNKGCDHQFPVPLPTRHAPTGRHSSSHGAGSRANILASSVTRREARSPSAGSKKSTEGSSCNPSSPATPATARAASSAQRSRLRPSPRMPERRRRRPTASPRCRPARSITPRRRRWRRCSSKRPA